MKSLEKRKMDSASASLERERQIENWKQEKLAVSSLSLEGNLLLLSLQWYPSSHQRNEW
jgi:hypothetical protein